MGKLDILPVKEKTRKKKQPKQLDAFFKENMPLSMNAIMVAPKNAGKTTILVNLIWKFYKDMFPGGIFYISPTVDSDRTLSAVRDDEDVRFIDEYSDELIEKIVDNIPKDPDKREETLIVLDDTTTEIPNNARIFKEWLTLRHKDLSILAICHRFLKFIPPIIRMNASNVFLLKGLNSRELEKIAAEYSHITDGDEEKFVELYREATKNKYNFMFINLEKKRIFKNFTKLLYQGD